jgi:hypothetical protein
MELIRLREQLSRLTLITTRNTQRGIDMKTGSIIEFVLFGSISFAFGYVSGMMPILDGITFGATYGLLLFLFIFHDHKKNNRHD